MQTPATMEQPWRAISKPHGQQFNGKGFNAYRSKRWF